MNQRARVLPISRTAPENRGPLIDAAAIRVKIGGQRLPSEKWVKANVPGKITLSYNIVRWYEWDVDAWIAEQAVKSRGAA